LGSRGWATRDTVDDTDRGDGDRDGPDVHAALANPAAMASTAARVTAPDLALIPPTI